MKETNNKDLSLWGIKFIKHAVVKKNIKMSLKEKEKQQRWDSFQQQQQNWVLGLSPMTLSPMTVCPLCPRTESSLVQESTWTPRLSPRTESWESRNAHQGPESMNFGRDWTTFRKLTIYQPYKIHTSTITDTVTLAAVNVITAVAPEPPAVGKLPQLIEMRRSLGEKGIDLTDTALTGDDLNNLSATLYTHRDPVENGPKTGQSHWLFFLRRKATHDFVRTT